MICTSTVELHLSGLIWMTSNLDMQTIWMIGFFFVKRPHWQSEVEKISTNSCSRLHTYLCTHKTLLCNSLYLFVSWGKNWSHKMQYNYRKTCCPLQQWLNN